MSRPDDLDRLTTLIAGEIPLSAAMKVQVESWDGATLILSAPLAPNRNDKATAFGGSLYALAVLAGWGALMLRLWQSGMDSEVVIQSAEVDYLAPVYGRIVASCACHDDGAWLRFMRQLTARGRGRLVLEPEVAGDEGASLRMRASFVARGPTD